MAHKTNGTVRKVHAGCPSLFSAIHKDLSCFIFETRQCRIQVSTRMVHQQACRLLPSFRNKTMEAKKKHVSRFTKTLGLTNYAAMHTAQIISQRQQKSQSISLQWWMRRFGALIQIISWIWIKLPHPSFLSFKKDTAHKGLQDHPCLCFYNNHKTCDSSCYCYRKSQNSAPNAYLQRGN